MGHGGVERGTIEVASAIVAAGGRALVASAGGLNVKRLERVGAEHIEMPVGNKNPLAIMANSGRIHALIQKEQVSLVHARSRAPAWAAKKAAKQSRVPFVTTYHGAYSESGFLKRKYNSVMASGDRVIAISTFIAALIERRYFVTGDRVTTIHRGADLTTFSPKAVTPGRMQLLLDRWRVPDDARIILMPGRLTRWKGQGVLLAAIARLKELLAQSNIAVVFVGSDQGRSGYSNELQQQLERLNLPPNQVVFAGHCDDIPAALMLASVVVSASIEPEAFGRTVVEASAMGKPVIAPNHGAAPEIIIHGQTGWLVPPNDPAALAEALQRSLALSQDEMASIANRAINRVQQHFSVERMCEETIQVYQELLTRKAA